MTCTTPSGLRTAALRGLALTAALGWAGPAAAQIEIGQMAYEMGKQKSYQQCLAGNVLPEDEVVEAREPAKVLVLSMWDKSLARRAGGEGSAKATRIGGRWLRGKSRIAFGSPAFLADPLAPTPAMALVAEPLAFHRTPAEPRNDAWGLWRLAAADDPARTLGYYRVTFNRFMLKWQLRFVEPFGPERVPDVRPFCDEADLKRAREQAAGDQ